MFAKVCLGPIRSHSQVLLFKWQLLRSSLHLKTKCKQLDIFATVIMHWDKPLVDHRKYIDIDAEILETTFSFHKFRAVP